MTEAKSIPSDLGESDGFVQAFLRASGAQAREKILGAWLAGKPGFLERRRVGAFLRQSGVPYDVYEAYLYGIARHRRPRGASHPLAWISITLSGYLGTRIAHYSDRARREPEEASLVEAAAAMDGEVDELIFASVYDGLRKKAPQRAAQSLDRVREVQRMTRRLRELPSEPGGGPGVPLAAVALAREFQAATGDGGLALLVRRLKAERAHRRLTEWGGELEAALSWRSEYGGAMRAVPVTECAVRAARITGALLEGKGLPFWRAWNSFALESLRPEDSAAVVDAEAVLSRAPSDAAEEFRDFTARHPGEFAKRYFLRRALDDRQGKRSEWARRLLAGGAAAAVPDPDPGPDAAQVAKRLEAKLFSGLAPTEALRVVERTKGALQRSAGLTPEMKAALGARLDETKKTLEARTKAAGLLKRLSENLATIDQRTQGNAALSLASKIRYCKKVVAEMKNQSALADAAAKLMATYAQCASGEWPYAKCLADEAKFLAPGGGAPVSEITDEAIAELLNSGGASDTGATDDAPLRTEAEDDGRPGPTTGESVGEPANSPEDEAAAEAPGEVKDGPREESSGEEEPGSGSEAIPSQGNETAPSETIIESEANAASPTEQGLPETAGDSASKAGKSIEPIPTAQARSTASAKTLGVAQAPAKSENSLRTGAEGKAPPPPKVTGIGAAAEADPVGRTVLFNVPTEPAKKRSLTSQHPVPTGEQISPAIGGEENPSPSSTASAEPLPRARASSLKTGAALLRKKAERFDLECGRVSLEDSLGLRAETPEREKERLILGALRSFLHTEPQTRDRLYALVAKDSFNPRAFLRWLEKHWLDALTPGDAVAFLDEVLSSGDRLVRLMESYPGAEALLAEPEPAARARLRLMELLANIRDSYKAELSELARFQRLFDGLKELEERHPDPEECLAQKAAFLSAVMEDAGEALVVRKKARQILGLLLLPDEEAIPSREALLAASEREFVERGKVTPLDGPAVEDLIRTRIAQESAQAEAGMEKLGSLESFGRAFLPAAAAADLEAEKLEAWVKDVLLELFRRAWVPAVKHKFLAKLRELLERRRLLSPPIQKILDFHAMRLERYKELPTAMAPRGDGAPGDELSELEKLSGADAGEIEAALDRLPRYRSLLRGSDPDLVLVGIRRAALEDRERAALLAVFQTQCAARSDWPQERREGVHRAIDAFRKSIEEAKALGAQKRAARPSEADPESSGEDGEEPRTTASAAARPPARPAETVDADAVMKEFYKKMDLNLQGLVAKHAAGNPRELFNEQYHFLQKERAEAKTPELRTFILKTVIPRINYAKNMLELLEKLARFTPAERARSHFARVREEIEAQYLVPLKGLRKDFNYFNAINFTARYKEILKKPLGDAIAAGLVIEKETVGAFLQKVGLI
ncbi:MAG: hypothetical protein J0L75_19335 [Spirochaetes bacterium]|nr:hypothetical protein [Spirochaetota bacterium]